MVTLCLLSKLCAFQSRNINTHVILRPRGNFTCCRAVPIHTCINPVQTIVLWSKVTFFHCITSCTWNKVRIFSVSRASLLFCCAQAFFLWIALPPGHMHLWSPRFSTENPATKLIFYSSAYWISVDLKCDALNYAENGQKTLKNLKDTLSNLVDILKYQIFLPSHGQCFETSIKKQPIVSLV